MAVVQFTVVPLGTGDTSLSGYIAEVERELDKMGIKHTLTPMGTVLEGSLDEVWQAIRAVHELPFNQGAKRVMTLINIDDRRDKAGSAEQKLASVRRKMGD